MRPVLRTLVAGVLTAGLAGAVIASAEDTTRTVTLKVDGISCKACVKNIRAALTAVPGVRSVEIQQSQPPGFLHRLWHLLGGGQGEWRATVACDSTVTDDRLVQAVAGASNEMFTYQASVMTEGG